MAGDGVLDVTAEDGRDCLWSFCRVEAILLGRADAGQGLDPSRRPPPVL